jgi:hypothetical protein
MKLLESTSLVFFTNFLHNTWKKEYIYAWLFLLLTTTSVFYHSQIFYEYTDLPELLDFSIHGQIRFLDKIIILCVVIYGLMLILKTIKVKEVSYTPMITFLSVCYLYIGGYFQNKYCFDPNIEVANMSHACLHIISSIGHHIIIYEYWNLQNMRSILLRNLLY